MKNVLVGISGGVDSAVAGYLLKKKGYSVIGAFIKSWDGFDRTDNCEELQDWKYAKFVCHKIKIPLIQINLVKFYWNKVFNKFLMEYENGLTPNPDILCNRYVKFEEFFKYGINFMGADAIATGHYAQTSFGSYLENYVEDDAIDYMKDQTFFLSNVKQYALKKSMFPVGSYSKSEVKNIALSIGLDKIVHKPESTGICFIGNRKFQDFILEYIEPKSGTFIDVRTGYVVGKHHGVHCWTVGQRCKISDFNQPYFVVSKNAKFNVIYVATGTANPALYTHDIFTTYPFWIRRHEFSLPILKCEFRFQHAYPLAKCNVYQQIGGLHIRLHHPVRGVTPGQYAVLYQNNECLGCAKII